MPSSSRDTTGTTYARQEPRYIKREEKRTTKKKGERRKKKRSCRAPKIQNRDTVADPVVFHLSRKTRKIKLFQLWVVRTKTETIKNKHMNHDSITDDTRPLYFRRQHTIHHALQPFHCGERALNARYATIVHTQQTAFGLAFCCATYIRIRRVLALSELCTFCTYSIQSPEPQTNEGRRHSARNVSQCTMYLVYIYMCDITRNTNISYLH